jgi:hypothetical protein
VELIVIKASPAVIATKQLFADFIGNSYCGDSRPFFPCIAAHQFHLLDLAAFLPSCAKNQVRRFE